MGAASSSIKNAIYWGDLNEVNRFIASGININEPIEPGNTNNALLYAASIDYLTESAGIKNHNVVKRLLEAGADPNYANQYGITPLIVATIHDHINLIDLLIGAKALVNKADKEGKTPLMWAAEKGNIRAFTHLMSIPGILIWKRDNGKEGGYWKKNAYVYAREYTMYHDEKDKRIMDTLKSNFIKLTGIDSDNDMFTGDLAEQIELRPYMKDRLVYAKYPQLDPSYKPPAPAPTPKPAPAPAPKPAPAPTPKPAPAPTPKPAPAPTPKPAPAPTPKPAPVPAPKPAPVPKPTPVKTPRVRFAETVKNNSKTAAHITGNFQSYPYQSGWQTKEERAIAKQEFNKNRENMPKGRYSRNNRKTIAHRASINENKINKLLAQTSYTRKRSRSKLR
jgi:Ankyrin repeats (3 copies)